jgi:hypothetical protein
MKLTKLETKANTLITDLVNGYRTASAGEKNAFNPDSKRAYTMMKDRQSGALDSLHQLFPNLPAWSETKWIH